MKISKLKENREFRHAYYKGSSYVTPSFVVYIVRNRSKGIRLGITTGKKIGKAVSRNRARRVITAAFAACLPKIAGNYDFVIVARTRILTVKSTAAAEDLMKILKSANALKAANENG